MAGPAGANSTQDWCFTYPPLSPPKPEENSASGVRVHSWQAVPSGSLRAPAQCFREEKILTTENRHLAHTLPPCSPLSHTHFSLIRRMYEGKRILACLVLSMAESCSHRKRSLGSSTVLSTKGHTAFGHVPSLPPPPHRQVGWESRVTDKVTQTLAPSLQPVEQGGEPARFRGGEPLMGSQCPPPQLWLWPPRLPEGLPISCSVCLGRTSSSHPFPLDP